MKTLLIAAVLVAVIPVHGQETPKEATARGRVSIGTLDSSIGGDENSFGFLTNSDVGRKIFAACKVNDECEVTGKVTGKYSQLISVSRVRLLNSDASQFNVLETPSFIVRIEVRCPEGNVTCEDVIYEGTSRKTGKSISLKGRTMHSRCADGVTPCTFQGYTFNSGKINYTVLQEGSLIVMDGDRTLVSEMGIWK